MASENNNSNLQYAIHLYQCRRFLEFQHFVENNSFEKEHWKVVTKLWYDSVRMVYGSKQKGQRCTLTRVQLKRLYPPPQTICCEQLQQIKKDYLVNYYHKNKYPTTDEIQMIANKLGLDVAVVTTFFQNRRNCYNSESPQKETVGGTDQPHSSGNKIDVLISPTYEETEQPSQLHPKRPQTLYDKTELWSFPQLSSEDLQLVLSALQKDLQYEITNEELDMAYSEAVRVLAGIEAKAYCQ